MSGIDGSEPVRILWTGGWDSTFRVACLTILMGRKVQPLYLIDPDRGSVLFELRAMQTIRRMINEKLQADMFLPTLYFNVGDLPRDGGITSSFAELRKDGHLGIQYEWLAIWLKLLMGSVVELTIHKDDRAYRPISDWLMPSQVNGVDSFVLNEDCPKAVSTIFGGYSFPLVHHTKTIMQKESAHHGFSDIMEKTWFCHQPKRGKPCGSCFPCKYALAENMGHRIPRSRRILMSMRGRIRPKQRWHAMLQRLRNR